jgi:phosphatidylglycerol:prolipoprotein diacylglycerol transferase
MYPFLVNRPDLGVQILSSVASIWVAIGLCLWWAPRWSAAREGLEVRAVRRALLVLAVIVLAGGRAHFVVNAPETYAGRWLAAFAPWGGGFHIGGGMVALALCLPSVVGRRRMAPGRFADGIVVPVAVAVLVTRVGCLLHGCCFGSPCHGPWCVQFPAASAVFSLQASLEMLPAGATRSLPVHALALYFGAAAALVAAVALWLRRRRRYEGEVALVAMLLFSATTAAIEGLRAGYGPMVLWAGRSQLQWTALAMTAAFLAALAAAEWRHARERRRVAARTLSPA